MRKGIREETANLRKSLKDKVKQRREVEVKEFITGIKKVGCVTTRAEGAAIWNYEEKQQKKDKTEDMWR